jgi:hypothetical protein
MSQERFDRRERLANMLITVGIVSLGVAALTAGLSVGALARAAMAEEGSPTPTAEVAGEEASPAPTPTAIQLSTPVPGEAPTPPPGGPPTATPQPVELPFSDNFESDSGYWQPVAFQGERWTITAGGLRMEVEEPGGSEVALLHGDYRDIDALVLAQDLSDVPAEYGIRFNISPSGDYYAFRVSSDGRYAVTLVRGDQETTLVDWTADPNIKTGPQAVNALGVITSGSTIVVHANGQQLARLEDGTLPSGSVALYAHAPGDPVVRVIFDEFRLSHPEGSPTAEGWPMIPVVPGIPGQAPTEMMTYIAPFATFLP